jgi:hypothetical protein
MSINTKPVETEILTNIDHLIKIIIQISQAEEEYFKQNIPEIEELLIKTNSLLKQLLQRNQLPLEQIYRQLIFQKLPRIELQKCSGDLEMALEAIFALPVFHNHLEKQPPTKT